MAGVRRRGSRRSSGARGPRVEVHVLESAELPRHWARLDEFEGSGYERVAVPVYRDGAPTLRGQIFAARLERAGR